MQLELPQIMEVKGVRVLTTKQIAEAYETKEIQIHQNFKNNRARFVEGKHYISLSGDELKAFKNHLEKIEVVKSRTSHLYLWTEKGALLHAKSLNTDKAWEVYDYLVDYYFRAKETQPEEKKAVVPVQTTVEAPKRESSIPHMDDPMQILRILLSVAESKGIKVNSFPFNTVDSMLKDNHIGIRTGITVEKACYELAWELSHAFIHYDNGNMIKSPLSKDYNAQAARAADMVIKILNTKVSHM